MSRIGKLPINLQDVAANIEGTVVILKKGNEEKRYNFGKKVRLVIEDGKLKFTKINPKDDVAAYLGLHRSNLNNIVNGLLQDYEIILEINGVGYKADVNGKFLVLSLGYSHDIAYIIPNNIKIRTEKPNFVIISGNDKQKVGQIASEIIKFKVTEPYKGTGIKKKGAWILRKEGKKK
jgi:large subunit ribosomal protein L6